VWEKAQAASLQGHRDWLTQQDNNLQALGLKVTTQVEWADDLKQNILDYVAEMKPDSIKQVQQESALKRAFFTPLDWKLLRESRCRST
jgi:universal stress protein E